MDTFPAKDLKLPVEVQLAWEVMTCRGMRTTYETKNHSCQWFNDHYGPYPAYDWITEFPKKILAEGEKRVLDAVCMGERFQVPELMSGCRKAPIMTVGINPNLSAFWPGVDGATWSYPYFDDIGQYAHYFRHRAICQERFSLDFIKEHVIPDTEVIAKADGWIKCMRRSNLTGKISLILEYEGQGDEEVDLEEDYEVFFNRSNAFKKADVIAGRVDLQENLKTTIFQEAVGYYERFRSIFDCFKHLVDDELTGTDLRLAEDVCQADMVACASPGWRKSITEKVREGIKDECVIRRGWLALQLLQTRPQVIVFSGKSALDMFYDVLGYTIEPPVELKLDTYELLQICTDQRYDLKIELPKHNISFQSRVVISPHFSYSDNFKPQCRFTKEQWQVFGQTYPEAVEKLEPVTTNNYTRSRKLVFIKDKDAPSKDEIEPAAWEELIAHLYDAKEMIAQVLLQEYQAGRIVLDKKSGHFVRTEGPCHFCVNELFVFLEGCMYGKVDLKRLTLPTLDFNLVRAARSLLKKPNSTK